MIVVTQYREIGCSFINFEGCQVTAHLWEGGEEKIEIGDILYIKTS